MTKNLPLLKKIIQLTSLHINYYSIQERKNILKGLRCILDTSIDNVTSEKLKINLIEFQSALSNINEKGIRRKKDGVYYTPQDVTEYIVANTFLNYCDKENIQVYSTKECILLIPENKIDKLLKANVFDPTCGTAEFLISAIKIKLLLFNKYNILKDSDILLVASSLYGNDISLESIIISKIRIYFSLINELKDKSNSVKLAKIIKNNFTANDYIFCNSTKPKYDIIVGNPPYVEYSKLETKPNKNYGNIYADVLHNSINEIINDGTIGFIVPLSFVSTPRMGAIRDFMFEKMEKLFVLNYADRPDCLFNNVHQKLTIIISTKGKSKCKIYSSSYYHWYNNERIDLLNNSAVFPIIPKDKYIPKTGNLYEYNIFKKIQKINGISLLEMTNISNDNEDIYLNLRATFWMKAFSFNPGSKEYKKFTCPKKMKSYILAILNSNLFFLYWTIVSDCWHITNKELLGFLIPINNVSFDKFIPIINKLEQKLDETKNYIGSAQTKYEYKHRECKAEIDTIDDALQSIYDLTNEELSFLKNYKLRYRMSYGKV